MRVAIQVHCWRWRASKMKRIVTLSWIFTRRTRIKAHHLTLSFLRNWMWAVSKFIAQLLKLRVDRPIRSRKATEYSWMPQKLSKPQRKEHCQYNGKQKFHWITDLLWVNLFQTFLMLMHSFQVFCSWKLVKIMYSQLYKSMKWYLQ